MARIKSPTTKRKAKGFLIVSKKTVRGKILVLGKTFKTKKEAMRRLKELNIQAKFLSQNRPIRELKIIRN